MPSLALYTPPHPKGSSFCIAPCGEFIIFSTKFIIFYMKFTMLNNIRHVYYKFAPSILFITASNLLMYHFYYKIHHFDTKFIIFTC